MSSSTRTRKAATAKRSAAKRSPAASKAAPSSAKKPTAKSSAAKRGTAKKKQPKSAAPAAKATANARRTPAKATAKKATTTRNGRPTKSTGSKTAAKAVNGRKKSPFSATFLARQKQALIDERAVYLHQAEAFEAEADSLIADFEPGDVQFDEESGEGDTLSMERERDLALSAQARAALEQIDHALAKFDLGTYGICEVSGDPIPKERLEAIPWAKERVEYKAASFTSP
jgi:RNA polymerase-binding transcription factor DksA